MALVTPKAPAAPKGVKLPLLPISKARAGMAITPGPKTDPITGAPVQFIHMKGNPYQQGAVARLKSGS